MIAPASASAADQLRLADAKAAFIKARHTLESTEPCR